MTKEERLEHEVDLFRTYRKWYNPAYATEEELQGAIDTQQGIVDMFQVSAENGGNEDTIDILQQEIMKLELWKDILDSRDPYKIEDVELE